MAICSVGVMAQTYRFHPHSCSLSPCISQRKIPSKKKRLLNRGIFSTKIKAAVMCGSKLENLKPAFAGWEDVVRKSLG